MTMAAVDSNDLARMRTTMAADRTLMAWVRTALSMISFGFTIMKFFQVLEEGGRAIERAHAARNLGVTLAALGVAGIIAAVLHYRRLLRDLGVDSTGERWSITVVTGLVVAAIGIAVIAGGLTGLGPF